jgi:hypothetical protein
MTSMLQEIKERRTELRFPIRRNVWVRHTGRLPAAGMLINVSRTGAAIQLRHTTNAMVAAWVFHLKNGEEVHLSGLLDEPVACWIVAIDDDLLRVRFLADAATRAQLDSLLTQISRTAGV